MIRSSGFAHVPLDGAQRGLITLSLFDLEFTKSLDDRAILDDRDMIDRELGDGRSVLTHHKAASPHAQCHDWPHFPIPKLENQCLEECGWWVCLGTNLLYFLPILPQRNLELPGLLPPFDSVTESDPRMG
jgi:hypothetical protein